MKIQIRSGDIGARLDGASNPMVEIENADMELWMVRNFLCEVAEMWSVDEINEILNTTSLRITDTEATPNKTELVKNDEQILNARLTEEASDAPLADRSGDWFGTWELETNKPATYFSVLVCGILDGEREPDTHEGYWDGKKWWSIRPDTENEKLTMRIQNVTHWTPRPIAPSYAAAQTTNDYRIANTL